MKKNIVLLLALCYSLVGFSQKREKIGATSSITNFYHKNLVYNDTVAYNYEYFGTLKGLDSTIFGQITSKISLPTIFSKPSKYTFDSIPELASVNVNGIYFENKKILSKMPDHEILVIIKDSIYSYEYNLETKKQTIITRYKRPHAIVYQDHQNLPNDFFFFKQYTLEPTRYNCSSYSPVFDVFHTEENMVSYSKSRVILDGRLQPKSFDYQHINIENIKHIDVFAKEDAGKYFGLKVKNGLVSIVTKNSNFNINRVLANTHVVGEIQDKNGNWRVIKDTLFTNVEHFREFQKQVYQTNGPVYLINGEFETEQINRKTFDIDAVESIKVASGKKISPLIQNGQSVTELSKTSTVANDTVYIKTEREPWTFQANTSISKVMSELKRLRNTNPDPIPIYIVDNQEITAEKLKEYKPKELEFIESLEGCDAIAKYGKRAEFGVVIYRKR